MAEAPACLSVDWVHGQFGQERGHSIRRFRNFVRDGMEAGNPFDKVKGQVALGGEAFLEQLVPILEGKAEIDEIPRQQRLAGRPTLAELFPGGQSRKERNAGIA